MKVQETQVTQNVRQEHTIQIKQDVEHVLQNAKLDIVQTKEQAHANVLPQANGRKIRGHLVLMLQTVIADTNARVQAIVK